jgi:hypothetical protein
MCGLISGMASDSMVYARRIACFSFASYLGKLLLWQIQARVLEGLKVVWASCLVMWQVVMSGHVTCFEDR